MKMTKRQSERVHLITSKMGIAAGKLDALLLDAERRIAPPREPSRLSTGGIIVAVVIGLTYICRQVVLAGFTHSIGTTMYVTFCVLMIASKRLLQNRIGTYYIGTSLHLPPRHRPIWWAGAALGWSLLILPGIMIISNVVRAQH
jgi:hypothetical protein